MVTRVPRLSRLRQDDHSATYKKLIKARFTAETATTMVFMVWGSSMIAVAGLKPKDNG